MRSISRKLSAVQEAVKFYESIGFRIIHRGGLIKMRKDI